MRLYCWRDWRSRRIRLIRRGTSGLWPRKYGTRCSGVDDPEYSAADSAKRHALAYARKQSWRFCAGWRDSDGDRILRDLRCAFFQRLCSDVFCEAEGASLDGVTKKAAGGCGFRCQSERKLFSQNFGRGKASDHCRLIESFNSHRFGCLSALASACGESGCESCGLGSGSCCAAYDLRDSAPDSSRCHH